MLKKDQVFVAALQLYLFIKHRVPEKVKAHFGSKREKATKLLQVIWKICFLFEIDPFLTGTWELHVAFLIWPELFVWKKQKQKRFE